MQAVTDEEANCFAVVSRRRQCSLVASQADERNGYSESAAVRRRVPAPSSRHTVKKFACSSFPASVVRCVWTSRRTQSHSFRNRLQLAHSYLASCPTAKPCFARLSEAGGCCKGPWFADYRSWLAQRWRSRWSPLAIRSFPFVPLPCWDLRNVSIAPAARYTRASHHGACSCFRLSTHLRRVARTVRAAVVPFARPRARARARSERSAR
jgi:hypothetical protein